ncbi:hypothetical protein CYLTODRAFT_445939 [Cylindrobasidium torrendii FP15055 ss-10]|uniref:Uncharacterized protein n=1 Tax=Cylindrobasidium torrendii FP15055 ss-10 TaxID=1314674 RepID=A0A0D7B216_9AGAR|nr:hypothetical protein CYLTODRAFT_445939 [Cylindrobasidium torrendii FP15055 ss-10]
MDAFAENSTHVFISSILNPSSVATRTLLRGDSTPLVVYDLEQSTGQPIWADVPRTTACALLHGSITQRGDLSIHHSDWSFINNVAKPVLQGKCDDIHHIARLFPKSSLVDVCWFAAALIKAKRDHQPVSFGDLPVETAAVLQNMDHVDRTPTPNLAELGPGSLCALIGDLLDSVNDHDDIKLLHSVLTSVSHAYPSAQSSSALPPDEGCLDPGQVHRLLDQCYAERIRARESKSSTAALTAGTSLDDIATVEHVLFAAMASSTPNSYESLVDTTAGTSSDDISAVEYLLPAATANTSNSMVAPVTNTSTTPSTDLFSPSATVTQAKEKPVLDDTDLPAPSLSHKRLGDFDDSETKRRKCDTTETPTNTSGDSASSKDMEDNANTSEDAVDDRSDSDADTDTADTGICDDHGVERKKPYIKLLVHDKQPQFYDNSVPGLRVPEDAQERFVDVTRRVDDSR